VTNGKTQSGIGFDVHRLVSGRPLILGGVEIAYPRGLQGHSDADVLVHAVCDALLGAVGEGDMGDFFPDTDPKFKGISSLELLKRVLRKVAKRGFRPIHLDTVVIAEAPKLRPFKGAIRRRLARALSVAESQVNVKAKTTEGLGLFGRSQGIASYAVVTVQRKGMR